VHFRPWAVTVAAIPATASSTVIRGRAFHVLVTWQNRRCSILFHFDVPGGKWQTSITSPVSSARTASWSFQSRQRQALEPPASQVTRSLPACG
jgi:hypothetical protein